MYVWDQEKRAFYNSKNVFKFFAGESGTLYADSDPIGEYTTREDAIKELNSLFRQLEAGATSYQVN